MTYTLALLVTAFLLGYFVVELGWGGGSPTNKDHNQRDDV